MQAQPYRFGSPYSPIRCLLHSVPTMIEIKGLAGRFFRTHGQPWSIRFSAMRMIAPLGLSIRKQAGGGDDHGHGSGGVSTLSFGSCAVDPGLIED